MRLIFARTARRPIAHALHPIHIGGYFLHCIILYDYLLNSYNWNMFENVEFQIFHPESQGNIEHFEIQVQSVHKKSLTRQKTEAVKIQSSTASNLLNSKAEHRQPALLRVRMVQGDDNEIQVPRPRPQQNGGVDGGGGGGGVEEQDQRERRRQGQ